MSESVNGNFSERVIGYLEKAQAEVETWRLQGSLGAMDAMDRFEKLKLEFRDILEEGERAVGRASSGLAEKAASLRAGIQHLLLQLNLGKAEAAEVYQEQKKRVMRAARELEHLMDWEEFPNPATGRPLRHDLQRLKLNLEILRLHYELKKLDSEEEWKKRIVAVIEHWKNKIEEHRNEWDKRGEKITGELQNAYDHLRTTLEQL